jgi:hypothetical protein
MKAKDIRNATSSIVDDQTDCLRILSQDFPGSYQSESLFEWAVIGVSFPLCSMEFISGESVKRNSKMRAISTDSWSACLNHSNPRELQATGGSIPTKPPTLE